MKLTSRLIKGLLTILMVLMILGIGARMGSPVGRTVAVPVAYADQGDFDTVNAGLKPVDQESASPLSQQTKDDMVKRAAVLAAWSHRLFSPLVNFFAFQIGNFLGNDYVFNGDMGKMLLKIWVISRNLVNIAFVFILLYMALNEIFNVTGESVLRKKWILFVLLLIGVNFSWLATRVVLDAGNVATNVAFSIPSGIGNPPAYGQCQVNNPDDPISGSCYPTAILAPADAGDSVPLYYEDKEGDQDNCAKVKAAYSGSADSAYTADNKINPQASAKNKVFQHRTSICVENLNLFKYDMNTSVVYLTYGMARIQNLVVATGGNGKIVDLTVGLLLSLGIQIGYTVTLLALFIALIIRMGILWLFVGFSPFMILVYWFQEKSDYDLGRIKFGYNEFINWAFVPAKVGAIFAVSFIMISAGQAVGSYSTTFVDNLNSKSGVVAKLLDPQSLFMGIGSLQTFIWLIMCLVVLWMGVFGVLGKMSIIQDVTKKIEGYGTSLASLVATAPYWAPVLPLGKGGEKMAIKEIVKGLDVREKMKKYGYEEENKPEDARRLMARTARTNLNPAYSQLEAGNNRLTQAQANKIATDYGFRDAAHMMTMDKDTLISAFRATAGNKEGQEDRLYQAIKAWSQPLSEDQLRESARRSAEAQKAAGVGETKPAVPAPPAATAGPPKPGGNG